MVYHSKALFLKQPYADMIANGDKTIEIRRQTQYRGEVLICATDTPKYPHKESGCLLAKAKLIDCKHVSELTEEEWQLTRAYSKREEIKNGYAWIFSEIKRIVELPVMGKGFTDIWADADLIVEYPSEIYLDSKGFKALWK